MKRYILMAILMLCFVSASVLALTPFWYGGIALDEFGEIIDNNTVNVTISIIQSGTTVLYTENFTGVATDQFAGFSVRVGSSVPAAFTAINSNSSLSIKCQVQLGAGPLVVSAIGYLNTSYGSIGGSGFLPLEFSGAFSEPIIKVTNTGSGQGIYSSSAGSHGVWGLTSVMSGAGILGDNSGFGEAVVGRTKGGVGVGAVVGRNDSSGYGVRGFNTMNGIGVLGQSSSGVAGRFEIDNASNTSDVLQVSSGGLGKGITVALTNAANNTEALKIAHSGSGNGILSTTAGMSVWGISTVMSGAGILGDNSGFGEAVVGRNRGGIGVGAVVGRNDSSGYGVRGFNTMNGIGVLGQGGSGGGSSVAGRFENINASNTSDVVQIATSGTGTGLAISMSGSSGSGIQVTNTGSGAGVLSTTAGMSVWGISSVISGAGILGDNSGFGEAVVGRNRGGNGVGAVVGRNDSSGYGVRGFSTMNGIGVLGQAGISGSSGVAGRFENSNASNTSDVLQVVTNSAGRAANFTGNVLITGDLNITGNLTKGSGSFVIDHPLDPLNKKLVHSFVESSDMKNIYDGVIRLDNNGEAYVELPLWFGKVNSDFRYQLTAIGGPGSGLYISQELKDNKFKISGGSPNLKVSWQITGIRIDPYAQTHRMQVEVDKIGVEKGKYMHPDAYGVKADAPVFEQDKIDKSGLNLGSGKSAHQPVININKELTRPNIDKPELNLNSNKPYIPAEESKKEVNVKTEEAKPLPSNK